jgi:cell division protein FtsW (lipid II flippase)
MKGYQIYFYLLFFCVLFIISAISLKFIDTNNNFKLIIDSIFKFSIGIFIIIFFLNKKNNKIDNNDKMLFILIGFIILLLINYIQLINIILKKDQKYTK